MIIIGMSKYPIVFIFSTVRSVVDKKKKSSSASGWQSWWHLEGERWGHPQWCDQQEEQDLNPRRWEPGDDAQQVIFISHLLLLLLMVMMVMMVMIRSSKRVTELQRKLPGIQQKLTMVRGRDEQAIFSTCICTMYNYEKRQLYNRHAYFGTAVDLPFYPIFWTLRAKSKWPNFGTTPRMSVQLVLHPRICCNHWHHRMSKRERRNSTKKSLKILTMLGNAAGRCFIMMSPIKRSHQTCDDDRDHDHDDPRWRAPWWLWRDWLVFRSREFTQAHPLVTITITIIVFVILIAIIIFVMLSTNQSISSLSTFIIIFVIQTGFL